MCVYIYTYTRLYIHIYTHTYLMLNKINLCTTKCLIIHFLFFGT